MIEAKRFSPTVASFILNQRADYTYKFNLDLGRHGWLRLTPAYSVKLVNEILNELNPTSRILDPFAGTATTPLCAGQKGYTSVGIELNPFLTWLGKTKSDIYFSEDIKEAATRANQMIEALTVTAITPATPPPIHNIQRWWNQNELEYLCTLKTAIELFFPGSAKISNLILVVFCRVLIKLSNAAFNHQSMSFRKPEDSQPQLFTPWEQFNAIFLGELKQVLDTASHNPIIKPRIFANDSRSLKPAEVGNYNCLITSPPYPNRMSYIRELRPYMYWLGYLNNGRDAGELDWQSIGGTWGIATSRLNGWEKAQDSYRSSLLEPLLTQVAHADNKNGQLMASYIARYFEDAWFHLSSVASTIEKGGSIYYIVGNSTFYNIHIPVELLYKDIMEKVGFFDVRIFPIRKRNSKQALYEFNVVGKKS